MSQTAFTPNHNGTRILQPISYKTLHGVPIHIYVQQHLVPGASYPSGGQDRIDQSLRAWAKSSKRHTNDQNRLCEYRYNKYIYCKGTILPASQAATVWRMEPPDVRERNEVPESFRRDEDVQGEVDAAREAVRELVDDYENDWRTQAEREDLLRGRIKRAKRFRALDSIHESAPIMCGKLAQPSPELETYWNSELRKYGLHPEIDFYPTHLVHQDYDRHTHSPDDEDDCDAGFEADGISYDGMRATVGDSPNDHQERKHWFPFFRAVLNEEGWAYSRWVPEGFTDINGWTPEREAEIRNHPKFPAFVALYQVFFSGRSIEELNINKDPNTVAQWLARAREIKSDFISDSDRQKSIGHYVCTVILNNRRSSKILAPLGAPEEAVKALNRERQKSRRKAMDNARQDAKTKRLGKKATDALITESVMRIDKAYEGVLVMEDRGFTIDDLYPVTPADVIFSSIK